MIQDFAKPLWHSVSSKVFPLIILSKSLQSPAAYQRAAVKMSILLCELGQDVVHSDNQARSQGCKKWYEFNWSNMFPEFELSTVAELFFSE